MLICRRILTHTPTLTPLANNTHRYTTALLLPLHSNFSSTSTHSHNHIDIDDVLWGKVDTHPLSLHKYYRSSRNKMNINKYMVVAAAAAILLFMDNIMLRTNPQQDNNNNHNNINNTQQHIQQHNPNNRLILLTDPSQLQQLGLKGNTIIWYEMCGVGHIDDEVIDMLIGYDRQYAHNTIYDDGGSGGFKIVIDATNIGNNSVQGGG